MSFDAGAAKVVVESVLPKLEAVWGSWVTQAPSNVTARVVLSAVEATAAEATTAATASALEAGGAAATSESLAATALSWLNAAAVPFAAATAALAVTFWASKAGDRSEYNGTAPYPSVPPSPDPKADPLPNIATPSIGPEVQPRDKPLPQIASAAPAQRLAPGDAPRPFLPYDRPKQERSQSDRDKPAPINPLDGDKNSNPFVKRPGTSQPQRIAKPRGRDAALPFLPHSQPKPDDGQRDGPANPSPKRRDGLNAEMNATKSDEAKPSETKAGETKTGKKTGASAARALAFETPAQTAAREKREIATATTRLMRAASPTPVDLLAQTKPLPPDAASAALHQLRLQKLAHLVPMRDYYWRALTDPAPPDGQRPANPLPRSSMPGIKPEAAASGHLDQLEASIRQLNDILSLARKPEPRLTLDERARLVAEIDALITELRAQVDATQQVAEAVHLLYPPDAEEFRPNGADIFGDSVPSSPVSSSAGAALPAVSALEALLNSPSLLPELSQRVGPELDLHLLPAAPNSPNGAEGGHKPRDPAADSAKPAAATTNEPAISPALDLPALLRALSRDRNRIQAPAEPYEALPHELTLATLHSMRERVMASAAHQPDKTQANAELVRIDLVAAWVNEYALFSKAAARVPRSGTSTEPLVPEAAAALGHQRGNFMQAFNEHAKQLLQPGLRLSDEQQKQAVRDLQEILGMVKHSVALESQLHNPPSDVRAALKYIERLRSQNNAESVAQLKGLAEKLESQITSLTAPSQSEDVPVVSPSRRYWEMASKRQEIALRERLLNDVTKLAETQRAGLSLADRAGPPKLAVPAARPTGPAELIGTDALTPTEEMHAGWIAKAYAIFLIRTLKKMNREKFLGSVLEYEMPKLTARFLIFRARDPHVGFPKSVADQEAADIAFLKWRMKEVGVIQLPDGLPVTSNAVPEIYEALRGVYDRIDGGSRSLQKLERLGKVAPVQTPRAVTDPAAATATFGDVIKEIIQADMVNMGPRFGASKDIDDIQDYAKLYAGFLLGQVHDPSFKLPTNAKEQAKLDQQFEQGLLSKDRTLLKKERTLIDSLSARRYFGFSKVYAKLQELRNAHQLGDWHESLEPSEQWLPWLDKRLVARLSKSIEAVASHFLELGPAHLPRAPRIFSAVKFWIQRDTPKNAEEMLQADLDMARQWKPQLSSGEEANLRKSAAVRFNALTDFWQVVDEIRPHVDFK